MEGSRHDRVILVISAYIVGFTTAFIAFGMNTASKEKKPIAYSDFEQVQTVQETRTTQVFLGIDSDGLFVSTPEENQLLTVNRETYSANTINSVPTPGMHVAVIDAELSRDESFAYFCEQLDEAVTTCDPYVYSLSEHTLHPVTINGEEVHPEISGHSSAWTTDNRLYLNGALSDSTQEPWVLVK